MRINVAQLKDLLCPLGVFAWKMWT
jgi:hypothetical protein